MERLGELARGPGQIFLTGGASAVLFGWREMTVDVDLKMLPEPAGVFEAIATLKDELNINVELASPDLFIPELPEWRERSKRIATFDVNDVVIGGNIIGLAANGTDPLGNDASGIQIGGLEGCIGAIFDDDVAIGIGVTPIQGDPSNLKNVISANALHGVSIVDASDISVAGNCIGTDATGTLDRGNGGDGIRAAYSNDVQIGGRDEEPCLTVDNRFGRASNSRCNQWFSGCHGFKNNKG